MKESSPRGRRDILVIVLWFIGTSACLYLFWRDLNMALTRLNEEPVGIITFKYNAAQRRFSDRVVWDRLQTRSPVYNGDFIRTAGLSDATITFRDGGAAIDLAENSLIQVHFEDSRASLSLTRGGVSAVSRSGAPLTLVSGDARVELGPDALVSASAGAEGLGVSVLEGSARVGNTAGTQDARAGDVFALSAGGSSPGPWVAVISPRPGARLLVPENAALPVGFTWRALDFSDTDSARIEISADRKFRRILASQSSADASSAFSFSLAPGTYFWRAYREGAEPPASASSGKLTIIHAPAPRTISPAEDQVYRYRTRFPSLRFQWTEQEHAFLYRLEVADNPGMDSPSFSIQAQGASFVSSGLGPGRWYWRVTPVFPEGFEGTALPSAVASFVIEQGGALEAPRLQAPADGSQLNIAREREDVYFSWRPGEEAASYTIWISPRADLSDPVIAQTLRDSFFVYGQQDTALQAGQYYWGVFLTDEEGVSSPVSPPRSFTALEDASSPRTIYPPDNYTVAHSLARDLRFAWKLGRSGPARFQMSPNADFSPLAVDEESSSPARGRGLPAGTYYWRVSSQAEGGSLQTPAQRLNVVPPFSAPVLESPRPAERLEVRADAQIAFRWRAVEGAQYYQFRLYAGSSAQGRPVYKDDFCQDRDKTLPMEAYPEGAFVWTVQAFAGEGPLFSRRTGLLAAGSFAMRRLHLVTLDHPPAGHAYAGLEALRQPTELRWSPGNAASTRFVLSQNPDPLAGKPLMDLRNPPKTIRLVRLSEGNYYWTIRAETRDGFDVSASAPSSFRVLPVPLLPEAGGRSPQDGYRVDAALLRESRTIAFGWQPVPGANAYIFSLLREEGGTRRLLLRAGPEESASYVLEDLRPLLAQGNFVWQVEALSRAADGFVEQRGVLGENRFQVAVPVPGNAARTKDPGILYGTSED
ncbi:MAG: FecR family protein [Spirochaetia bacterium]|jgi:hypothetical protein|nr:FecR family protein [Spirochaetia bacterium]